MQCEFFFCAGAGGGGGSGVSASVVTKGCAALCATVALALNLQLLLQLPSPDTHSTTEAYCMPRFKADCSHPDNFGCSRRCALYLIITYNCVTDAYDTTSRTFNTSCFACNMCWDKSREQRAAAQQAPYALVWARGPTGALFENHWLVGVHKV